MTETLMTPIFRPLPVSMKTLKLSEATWFVHNHTEKEWMAATHNRANTSPKHYVERKKPDREECITYYIPLSSGAGQTKLWGQKSVFGSVDGGGVASLKGAHENFWWLWKSYSVLWLAARDVVDTSVTTHPLYPFNLFILYVNWVSTDWFNFFWRFY